MHLGLADGPLEPGHRLTWDSRAGLCVEQKGYTKKKRNPPQTAGWR